MKIAEIEKDELAERLFLSVVNSKDCEKSLFNFPHVDKGSFSLLVQLFVGEKNHENRYTSCITVTNDIFSGWEKSLHVSKDEMFSMAFDNSKKMFPVLVEPVNWFFEAEKMKENGFFMTDGINLPNCLVLSNSYFYNGAAALFYEPDILSKMAKKLDTKGMYLLPSSTNHFFCVPYSELLSKSEVEEIFHSLAAEDDKVLSESILAYDAEKNMITEKNGETWFPGMNNLVEPVIRPSRHI